MVFILGVGRHPVTIEHQQRYVKLINIIMTICIDQDNSFYLLDSSHQCNSGYHTVLRSDYSKIWNEADRGNHLII